MFPNYNVDCEWNKVSDDPKYISVNGILESIKRVIDDKIKLKEDNTNLVLLEELQHLLNDNSKTLTDQSGNTYVNVAKGKDIQFKKIRPDIIIHTRGTKQNICVIEVKKESNTHEHEKAKLYNLIKLYALRNEEADQYKVGIYIEFPSRLDNIKDINIVKSKTLDELFPGQSGVYEVEFNGRKIDC